MCCIFLSGQRREGDFQFHFDSAARNLSLPVIVLSIDIVHHLHGDLTCARSVALWIDLILVGLVPFSLGGPPCESFLSVE